MITVPEHPLHFVGRQQTSGEVDYVQDGRLHQGANAPSVLVDRKMTFPCSTSTITQEPSLILPVSRKCGSWA